MEGIHILQDNLKIVSSFCYVIFWTRITVKNMIEYDDENFIKRYLQRVTQYRDIKKVQNATISKIQTSGIKKKGNEKHRHKTKKIKTLGETEHNHIIITNKVKKVVCSSSSRMLQRNQDLLLPFLWYNYATNENKQSAFYNVTLLRPKAFPFYQLTFFTCI